ncbi:MAG: MotA/TolQ/ExbB proton channel family protein [Elusimicrobia bacterium]|nr:MotA/TolQ/ExbB proton channel family protein [Elusimicrobiota bacterium]
MNELGALKTLAYAGGEWVIYMLILSSVLTVAVIVERYLVSHKEKKYIKALRGRLASPLENGDLQKAAQASQETPGAVARILSAGLRHASAGPSAVEEYISAARSEEKRFLERRLLILGTLGNNAPFIGLFGTVLGVIKAFHDLAETASAGPEVVMQGLSEALVATAVGLLVAIPAVMAYNYFQKGVNDLLSESESFERLLLAGLKDESKGRK